jgi:Kef-type K+ transport system membrane component KefB
MISSEELFARLMLAIATVIIAARLAGSVAGRLGQPRVMGEVAAGILLGPTFLGAVRPDIGAYLFPPTQVVPLLSGAANIGLTFYMFLVGFQLDVRLLSGRTRQVAVISSASMLTPMLLGIVTGVAVHSRLAPSGIDLLPFALFVGVSLSITAVPVLARIIEERGMLGHPIGALALACAAVDDVAAWALLALATGLASATAATGDPVMALVQVLALTTTFCLAMALGVRRILGRVSVAFERHGRVPFAWLGSIYLGVVLSAAVAGLIGVAPIFGAFVMGLVMPRGKALIRDVTRRLEGFIVIVLLPLFFAVAGLQTDVRLLNDPELAGLTLAIIGIAIAAKLGAAAAAARILGAAVRESLAIGALMNTRGLTELIVLNTGLQLGVISPTLFTMLVIMTLVTTFMTGPLLRLIDPARALTSPSGAGEG